MIRNIMKEKDCFPHRHLPNGFTRTKRIDYDSCGNRIPDNQINEDNRIPDNQINEEILNGLVQYCRKLGTVKPLLIMDYIRETNHVRDAQDVLVILCGITRMAINDEDYRVHLNMWLNGESDFAALQVLVADSLEDRRNYHNNKQIAHQIDVIDSAWPHVDEHEKHLTRMEGIRQFAVKWGARFSDVCVDHDLSHSNAFCKARQDMMDPDDLDRLDAFFHADQQESCHDEPQPG